MWQITLLFPFCRWGKSRSRNLNLANVTELGCVTAIIQIQIFCLWRPWDLHSIPKSFLPLRKRQVSLGLHPSPWASWDSLLSCQLGMRLLCFFLKLLYPSSSLQPLSFLSFILLSGAIPRESLTNQIPPARGGGLESTALGLRVGPPLLLGPSLNLRMKVKSCVCCKVPVRVAAFS